MPTTSMVSGYGTDGRFHEVRIVRTLAFRRGAEDVRYIVCGTCDQRRAVRGPVRSEAAHHLAEHGAARGGARQRLSPAPWILGLIGAAGFLAVFAAAVLGH
ncbi:hypothetical protein [Streptomyces megasporus]|uniref:hypothetical protein n=1 Tax=Streptomyces megasporus TaxID=44060 RepID=UPI0012FE961A|nr:hypothetical protein [Streptomyces megasporus]